MQSWGSFFKKYGSAEILVWGNLALRLVLWAFVLKFGTYFSGDAQHYTHYAGEVCRGDWGGEPNRVPLYLWYLCALSPSIIRESTPAMMAVPLLFQTLIIWFVGFWLWKKMRAPLLAIAFWLFDPALLIYSNFALADPLFAVCIFAMSVQLRAIFKREDLSEKRFALLGLCLACTALMRPPGIPLVVLTIAVLWIYVFMKGFELKLAKNSVLALFVFFLAIAPRLYWNATRHHSPSLALQGNSWIVSVAGTVENHGRGLDFFQAEKKWMDDHKIHTTMEAVKTLTTHFPTWAYLSAKGALRILFGHVNVEWGYFFLKEAPIGPGWFKVSEQRQGIHVRGPALYLWIAGLLFTASFCGFAYYNVTRQVRALGAVSDPFLLWALASIAMFVLLPQVYGDARFRLPIWPLLILLWVHTAKQKRENT